MDDGASAADYFARRLNVLCEAAAMDTRRASESARVFRSLLEPWSARLARRASGWTSEVSDDTTPVEFSIGLWRERCEVRALFEPQGDTPSIGSYCAAGLALHDRLEREFGADLSRFRRVQDLFLPRGMRGPFAVWSSVVFSPSRPPAFKAYFNPLARGAAQASALVEAALDRLGIPGAWTALAGTALRRGPRLDELKYFALDLTSEPRARVKVYVRHHDATPAELEAACSGQQTYAPGAAGEFARAMTGGVERLSARAAATCTAFVGGEPRPSNTTLYVPVCAYARDDAVVRDRVRATLRQHGLPTSTFDTALARFAERDLDAGVGMQSWVALQGVGAEPRVTVYLATEATSVFAPGTVPAPTAPREPSAHRARAAERRRTCSGS